jgi:hypothetical protein
VIQVTFGFTPDSRKVVMGMTRIEEHDQGPYCGSGDTIAMCGCGWVFTPPAYERRKAAWNVVVDEVWGDEALINVLGREVQA